MKNQAITLMLAALVVSAFTIHSIYKDKSAMLNHIALSVVDLKKSTAFYTDIIQAESIPEPFKDGKHTWFRIAEHSQLHLIQAAKEIIAHDKNTHICFSVPSIEDFMARLEKNNINYSNWPGDSKTPTVRADGVKQIYLQDPDGYWVEINNDKY
jgi:lactoylglutathione lyase